MASNRNSPKNPSTHQSIPLQDLSRPPDPEHSDPERSRPRKQSTGRARALLGNRRSFHGSVNTTNRYERIDEGSPPGVGRNTLDAAHVTTPRNAHQPSSSYEDGELSPVNLEEQAAFQAAVGSMGLMGLSFEAPGPSRPSLRASTSAPGRADLGVISESEGISAFTPRNEQPVRQTEDYFPPSENDRTPLTNERYLQPISGAQASTSSGQSHDRRSLHSTRMSPGARLGDDLPNVEAGSQTSGQRYHDRMSSYSTRSITRSLSTSTAATPLSTAGTMLRKMSQRVVNLSNEPEIVEQSIRRQASSKHARLEAPPSFPAMIDYAHDEPTRTPGSTEKGAPLLSVNNVYESKQQQLNPLKGNTLGIFGPENPVRLLLCEMLVHPLTEPIILILIVIQTLLLAIQAAPALPSGGRGKAWQVTSWIDWFLLFLFILYTLEIIARTIVSGFIRNAYEYSTLDSSNGLRAGFVDKARSFFAPQRQQSTRNMASPAGPQPSILRSFTSMQTQHDQIGHSRQQQRVRLARRAFLRHSFDRLDFLAVVSFWISFFLAVSGAESSRHIYLFRMLSCLRILRLLSLTNGTSVILRSLKKAAPLLTNVALLIGFFWLLFAIIGAQMFQSSFRRTCMWFGDIDNFLDPNTENYTQNDAPENVQFCGGYLNATTGAEMPWRKADLITPGTSSHKGFLCPQNSICVEGGNPYNGTVSFDNVLQSLELVFVIISSNTFSDLLYYTTNSDFEASAIFFAFGIVIMSLWLANLLVAVITSSFQVIREESKASAFTADDQPQLMDDDELEPQKVNPLKRLYNKTFWLWIIVIIFDLIVQCLRSADQGPDRAALIDVTEIAVTIILLVEIFLRFVSDWRNFHTSLRNWVDLALAVITAIIQLPPIKNSHQVYAWLTVFQILRIYRVVLAVSITRDLIMQVLGNVTGLLNLIVFAFLITFLSAIFAVQLFRGDFPVVDQSGTTVRITFTDIYNSFIGMYQVLSSENWTILLYGATAYDQRWDTSWIGAMFFILWFILANFIILNMFIAVIQENFDVTEDEKRVQQVRAFLAQKDLGGSSHSNLSLATILNFGRDTGRHKDPIDYGPATLEMLLKDAVVQDFLNEQMEPLDNPPTREAVPEHLPLAQSQMDWLSRMWKKIVNKLNSREPNPFYSRLQFSRAYDELDPRTLAHEVVTAAEQRRRAQRSYLQRHPRYNVSLFLFKPSNPIRKFCQRLVGPGRGSQRVEGLDPVKPLWFAFSSFLYAVIVVMVILACVATPLYQKENFHQSSNAAGTNWVDWTDMSFALVFTVEAIIKIIADGFFWTPNAYFRGTWGLIDGLVLVTLWINVITSLDSDSAIARAVGAFKALRALRLLQVSDSARETFNSVITWKVISSAFVSLSLLFPFAIYGLNLFNGQLQQCNDMNSGITNLTDCVGEYMSTPFNWDVLAPRQVSNSYYDFDNFGDSLFILFQIVSQEGWVDVMWQAMSAGGRNVQLQPYQSQGNAVFFIIFNLLGAVFVLTLFVSVFMRNYTEHTGVAFLTAEQRSWLELRKLLRQISPSKRPSNRPNQTWRIWCYRIATKKHGKWAKFMTGVLCVHLILLMLQFYPIIAWWELTRDIIFAIFTILYIANIVIRIVGLTWRRFRRSSWDLFSLLSVGGTLITGIVSFSKFPYFSDHTSLYIQLHRLFLVSIALHLIPRNNQLDQLFKTAAASLTAIGNLLATWFVLFLVFAIALTQTLGLTRFGSQGQANLNFRTVPNALILLFRMSCGEGWNQIMEDFANSRPPNCVASDNFFDSDCGSAPWARTLFIAWNIVSMYIFVSMFVSLIFESFSYVYQRSSGLPSVSRKEIRRFKQAWATFDPEGKGYISEEAFPKLLGELSGIFEMRVYDGEHSVGRILEDCRVEVRGTETPPPGVIHGVDLALLNKRLSTINVNEIRRRRDRLKLFSQEVLVSADPDRGIAFTSCLLILAHYNIISDTKSLKLQEFLRRRARLQRVTEEVNRRTVLGFFDTLYWSRQFRQHKELRHSARMMTIPQFAVPEIFVDDQDAASPRDDQFLVTPGSGNFSPMDIGFARNGLGLGTSPPQNNGLRNRGDSLGSSPSRSAPSPNLSPQLHPRRPSDAGNFPSFDGASGATDNFIGSRSRQNSINEAQQVLDTFDNSPWGQSMRISGTSPTRSDGSGPRRPSQPEDSSPPGLEGVSGVTDMPEAGRDRRSRAERQNALESFGNSAWGESIQRSFTLRRNGTRGRHRRGTIGRGGQ